MPDLRIRPERLSGYMEHAITPDGTLYVFLGWDDVGLREVFAIVGRGGGTVHGLAEGLGRMISLDLQHSVPVPEITALLKGIRSAHAGEGGEGAYLSIPDAVARIIEQAPTDGPLEPADAAYKRGFADGRSAGIVAALETASGCQPPEHCNAEAWEAQRTAADDLLARLRDGTIERGPSQFEQGYDAGRKAGAHDGYQAGLEAALQTLCGSEVLLVAPASELTWHRILAAARTAIAKLREEAK